jgi:hypothetical protein
MTRRAEKWVGSADNNLMETLSDTAKAVASMFGMMTAIKGELVFHMRESRPSQPMQAGLDELVKAGAIKCESINQAGGVRYVPQLNLSDFTKWLGRNIDRPEVCFPITVPLADGEKDQSR